MWITRLTLSNVKSYDEAGQEVRFRRGVNLIRGRNGAGKSTILEAIGFALFDSAAYAQDAFVREGARGGRVVVAFESGLDEREYEVVRGVGRSEVYVYDPELDARVAEKKEDTYDFIRQHLRLDAGTDIKSLFQDAIGVPQGTMTAVFLENPPARKAKFDRLLRVEEYERAWTQLRGTSSYIDGLINENARQGSVLKERLLDLPTVETQIAHYQTLLREDEARQAEVTAALAELAERLGALDAVKRQLDDLDRQLGEAQTEHARLEAQRDHAQNQVDEAETASQARAAAQPGHDAFVQAEAQLNDLRAARDRLQAVERLREQLAAAQDRAAEAKAALQQQEARLAERQAAFAGRAALDTRQAALDADQSAARQAQAEAQALLAGAKRDLADLAEREQLLGAEDATCPVCFRPVDEHTRGEVEAHYQRERKRLNARQEDAAAQADAAQTQLATLDGQRRALTADLDRLPTQAMIDDAQGTVAAAQATLARYEDDVEARQQALAEAGDIDSGALAGLDSQISGAQEAIEAHRADFQRYLAQQEAAARLPERQEALAALEAAFAAAQAAYVALEAQRAEIAGDYDAAEYDRLRGEATRLNNEAGQIAGRMAANRRDLEAEQSRLADLQAKQSDLEGLAREAARLVSRQDAFRFVREGIREAGPKVTQRLVRSVAAEANRIFGDILGDYSMGLDWGEDYAISVNYRGETRGFSLLSGGEQMAAAMAVRLALLSQVADVRFAFFDEPTANLDDQRRTQLGERLGEIRSLQQVFVISHDDTFEQESFHVIEVRKEDGISRVEVR